MALDAPSGLFSFSVQPGEMYRLAQFPHLHLTGQFELHERDDLARALGLSGSSVSDADLILHAYTRWNSDLPAHLDGQFSIVVWDDRQRSLFACRDHLGTLPLVYLATEKQLCLAGDMQTLLKHARTPRRLNANTLASCLVIREFRASPTETLFQDLVSLPPGTSMLATARGLRLERYWHPSIRPELVPSAPEAVFERTRHLVEMAVANRIRNRSQVSLMYSGGLDSAVLAVVAAKYLAGRNQSLLSFAAVNQPGQNAPPDERHYMERLNGLANMEIRYVPATGRGPFDGIEDPANFHTSCVRYSRLFLDQAITREAEGAGSDLLMSGVFGEGTISANPVPYFLECAANLRWRTLMRELRATSARTRRSPLRLFGGEVFRHFLPPVRRDETFFFRPGFLRDFRPQPLGRNPWWPDTRRTKLKATLDYLDRDVFRSTLPPDLAFAPASVYADRKLLEFCLAVPSEFKARNGIRRYLIRKSFENMLPPEIAWRPGKVLYSPDYYCRYNAQLHKATEFVRGIRKSDPVREIVDVDRLEKAIRPVDPLVGHPDALSPIPRSIYLINFLRQFPAFSA